MVVKHITPRSSVDPGTERDEAPLLFTGASENVVLSSLIRGQPLSHSILVNPYGADPWITDCEGGLLYTQTTGRDVRVWTGRDLWDVIHASPAVVWSPDQHVRAPLRNLWAPELHRIGGSWYLYVAADDGRNHNHRMYVLESGLGPLGPFHLKGKLSVPDQDRWAIDGTVTHIHGQLYYAWSGWPGARNGRQNIYLARMDNPWTLTSDVCCISRPRHPWESWINEGPQFLHRGSDTFIVYSANKSWTDDYKLGLLRLEGANPLDLRSWRKWESPVFDSRPEFDEPIFAPGHSSFFTDIHGYHWILYHVAKGKGAGWHREVRAQQWRWNERGEPDFGHPLPVRTNSEGRRLPSL